MPGKPKPGSPSDAEIEARILEMAPAHLPKTKSRSAFIREVLYSFDVMPSHTRVGKIAEIMHAKGKIRLPPKTRAGGARKGAGAKKGKPMPKSPARIAHRIRRM